MPIKRHKSLQPLSRDHHQGLILAQQLKKTAPTYKGMPSELEQKRDFAISFYNSDLKSHFHNEEEILFAMVKNRDDNVDRLIDDIVNEHRKLESLFLEIENSAELENKLDELGWLLEKHIRKEERNLFGEIEKILTDIELIELEKKLQQ